MKKKRLQQILFVLALAVLLTISVQAYMFHKSQTVSNAFTPAKVDCSVNEVFDGTEKSGITVTNTGNVDAYIRVRLVFHWEDSKGNVVGWNMDPPNFNIDTNKWKLDSDDGYTYYYVTPVAPGKATENLLTSSIKMEPKVIVEERTEGNQTIEIKYFYYPVVEVLAEAVQSNPDSAVKTAWPGHP